MHYLLHGKNTVTVEVKSYLRLLFEEVLTPFYIFQAFAIVLWSAFEEYYYYAGAIALISIVSVTLTLVGALRTALSLAGPRSTSPLTAHDAPVRRLKRGATPSPCVTWLRTRVRCAGSRTARPPQQRYAWFGICVCVCFFSPLFFSLLGQCPPSPFIRLSTPLSFSRATSSSLKRTRPSPAMPSFSAAVPC